jgi:hypothetical protein
MVQCLFSGRLRKYTSTLVFLFFLTLSFSLINILTDHLDLFCLAPVFRLFSPVPFRKYCQNWKTEYFRKNLPFLLNLANKITSFVSCPRKKHLSLQLLHFNLITIIFPLFIFSQSSFLFMLLLFLFMTLSSRVVHRFTVSLIT